MKLTNFVHNVVGYCTSNAESMVVVNVEVECTSLARLKRLVKSSDGKPGGGCLTCPTEIVSRQE